MIGAGRVSFAWALLLALSIALGLLIALSGIARPISNLIYDRALTQTAPPARGDVLIVAIDDPSIAAVGKWPWRRDVHAAIVEGLARAGARRIVYDVLFTEVGQGDARLAAAIASAPPLILPALAEVPGANGAPYDVKPPLRELLAAGAQTGISSAPVDQDGVLRRMPWRHFGLPHLAALANGMRPQRDDEVRIAFASPGAFRTISASSVLDGSVPAAFIRDRIVLVGVIATGLGDRFATPVGDEQLMPGVETIANFATNIAGGAAIADTGATGAVALTIPALIAMALAFLRLRPLASSGVVVALIAGCLCVAVIGLGQGRWIDPAPAMLTLLIAFPAWGWHRLDATSRFVDRQIQALSGTPAGLEVGSPGIAHADRLDWRAGLLARQIEQADALRRFIATTFESLPDPTAVIDAGGRIAVANEGLRTLFRQYAGRDAPPSAVRALAMMRGHVESRLAAVTDGRGRIALVGDRHFEVEATMFRAAPDAPAFRILRFGEVTAQVRAERERQHALEFLSHDLRAPQASILGVLAQAKDRIAPDAARDIERLASRTLSLSQSFVEIARARAGAPSAVPVDLAACLIESVELYWRDFQAKRIAVSLTTPEDGAPIAADTLLVSRAIQNILVNAVRHVPEGGKIGARVMRRSEAWACVIDDNGPGIARERLCRLFDRFETSAAGSGGTGLGLSLVRAVADAYGGMVRCASREGRGTRFVLAFPALDEA